MRNDHLLWQVLHALAEKYPSAKNFESHAWCMLVFSSRDAASVISRALLNPWATGRSIRTRRRELRRARDEWDEAPHVARKMLLRALRFLGREATI